MRSTLSAPQGSTGFPQHQAPQQPVPELLQLLQIQPISSQNKAWSQDRHLPWSVCALCWEGRMLTLGKGGVIPGGAALMCLRGEFKGRSGLSFQLWGIGGREYQKALRNSLPWLLSAPCWRSCSLLPPPVMVALQVCKKLALPHPSDHFDLFCQAQTRSTVFKPPAKEKPPVSPPCQRLKKQPCQEKIFQPAGASRGV